MSFASFHVDTLGIDAKHVAACRRGGYFTAAEVLLAAPLDIRRKIRGGANDAVEPSALIKAVAASIAPQAVLLSPSSSSGSGSGGTSTSTSASTSAAAARPAQTNTIKTGDAGIDTLLGGGVRCGAITELVGESAAGKSHLTLLLALAAQHPTLSSSPGATLVVSSERILETNRLVELAHVLRARHGGPEVPRLLDNIHTTRVADIEALEHALMFVIPPMLERARADAHAVGCGDEEGEGSTGAQAPVRLIIIDSITALLRGDTERSSAGLTQRSRHICTVSDRLKALAAAYDLAVVVVNQVKDVFGPEPGAAGAAAATQAVAATQAHAAATQAYGSQLPASQYAAADDILPPMLYSTQAAHFSGTSPGVNKEGALGIVWANAVNTRVMLARTGRRRLLAVEDVTIGRNKGKRARLGTPSSSASAGRSASAELQDADAPADRTGLEVDSTHPTLVRQMHLVFSHAAPPAMLDYIITPSGVHALAGSYRVLDLGPAIRRRDLKLRAAIAERRERERERERQGAAWSSSQFVMPSQASVQASQARSSDAGEDDDAEEVYDDLGELPAEFWEGIEALDGPEPMAVGVVD